MDVETDPESMDGINNLHRDLLALSEARLANVDRLWSELEARIAEFKNFLDKPKRNEKSRQALLSGNRSRKRTYIGR